MSLMRRVAVVVACVPVLVLAGCGDDEPGEPVEFPSLSPSAPVSPSASESVGVEELPASEVEPEEFVRAWVGAYDEATFTGDATRMRSMSSPECLTCESLATAMEEIVANGGSVDVGDTPTRVDVTEQLNPEKSSGATEVTVELGFPAGVTRETRDSEPIEFGASTETWVFYVAVIEERWIVTEVAL
ncbi:DUF6318 family protein [Nocardioides sp. AE5]|uniref:DUF6318 family protein n=1 Tax=Nocardioides sp. AE5 TaxID=2962573 RepID=UPI0028829899|nr:DUF6318 family protein [Nocardioides sp. AE5]MDT0203269.1 DUF6318 family protein [Nocardioides sp. AE5]